MQQLTSLFLARPADASVKKPLLVRPIDALVTALLLTKPVDATVKTPLLAMSADIPVTAPLLTRPVDAPVIAPLLARPIDTLVTAPLLAKPIHILVTAPLLSRSMDVPLKASCFLLKLASYILKSKQETAFFHFGATWCGFTHLESKFWTLDDWIFVSDFLLEKLLGCQFCLSKNNGSILSNSENIKSNLKISNFEPFLLNILDGQLVRIYIL